MRLCFCLPSLPAPARRSRCPRRARGGPAWQATATHPPTPGHRAERRARGAAAGGGGGRTKECLALGGG